MRRRPIRMAIVGLGKIARDQHIPAIAATPGIDLVAIASRHATLDGVAHAVTLDELLAGDVEIDAVALCTPPQMRREQAAAALKAGKHVLLEKPPGATLSEIGPLVSAAQAARKTLFASWHSRFAPAVDSARGFLADRVIKAVTVTWKEDIRIWHPGQDWILDAGGLGVFDPGINALSILTRILPRPFFLGHATLDFPSNRDAPIAAQLHFSDETGLTIEAAFDFLQTGPQSWEIRVETDSGLLTLSDGGARLARDGTFIVNEPSAEYLGLYRHFVDLITRGASDVDLAPLAHVADAFMLGRRTIVAPFVW